jgi:DNA modification methylase
MTAILLGDCREVMRTLDANSVDAIVTDPPYEYGFMGKKWDASGVAFDPVTWAEALRVAKPGAHLAAFGGTRTFHRMACAIEDAGWELRDTLMWVYGSGFPKSHNGEWGGTALKPAWEPIVLARKPLIGTVEANWREHGTGALNIDGCRIRGAKPATTRGAGDRDGWGMQAQGRIEDDGLGRWPANLVHDGSEEVVAQFPNEAGASAPVRGTEASAVVANAYGERGRVPGAFHGDTGSAARFFYCAKASREDRNDGCDGMAEKPLLWSSGEANPGSFQAEGTKRAAQNNHPTVKPTDLMRWLCRLVAPKGGLILDPFTGSGSTGRGAILEGFRFTGIELDPAYLAIAEARIAAAAEQRRIDTAQLGLFEVAA